MKTISRTTFTTVKTEGGILPADLLQRIAEGRNLEGLRPEDDYHLFPGERLNEAINRAWNRCLGAWRAFDAQRARLPESDRGTTLTRERWLLILFHELGYGRLQYVGSLPTSNVRASSVKTSNVKTSNVKRQDDVSRLTFDAPRYPISHAWSHTPIHLTTFRQETDRRGTEKRSPHSLMQEFLNRSDDHLWGFISNGLRLRVLRDNVSLTRAAYVEFDLEAMMTGEHYADFALLWLVCHQSRVEGPTPEQCWLERWSKTAAEQGVRALDALRGGVQEAIVALGRGFLAHRTNTEVRERLREGSLSGQDYYRQLLRLVYRLIFLFVAEDRDLLLVRQETNVGRQTSNVKRQDDVSRLTFDESRLTFDGSRSRAKTRAYYEQYYSLSRLRTMAETLRGGPHADLYRGLRLLFGLLREGYPPLGLPALGSFLFSEKSTPDLDGAELDNVSLLEAIRALAFTTERNVRRPVDYRNLGTEELGSVYESLLELHPQINADAAAFDLHAAAGSERKTTGSYYTPASLIQCLLDSALEPVIEDRLVQVRRQASNVKSQADVSRLTFDEPFDEPFDDPEEVILSIKVVDPACGSGHFLIAAAHRLARHLARARTGDEEPAPAELRAALRDVVRHCIHGVDINPMAVELCKVALWMETLDPGKPLSFLDRNIQCGNSLIGVTPALLEQGIPDDAFKPITGDDKVYCREFKKKNRQQREGQLSLFAPDLQPWERLGNLAAGMLNLDGIGEDTLEDVHRKQEMYEELVRSSDYEYGRLWADAWCAAFVWKKTKEFAYPITEEVFRRIERNPFDVVSWIVEEIERLREQYQFFHWHLAFPQVFRLPVKGETPENEAAGWSGGFDVVLGNPPWDRPKPEPAKFFASREPDISNARTSAIRSKMLKKLSVENPPLFALWKDYERTVMGTVAFLTQSSRYELTAAGKFNLGNTFIELSKNLLSTTGRAGMLNVSGLATDDSGKHFIADVMQSGTLASFYDFENRQGLFPGVHRSYKFSAITLTNRGATVEAADFVFYAQSVSDLDDETRHVTFTDEDIRLLNPLSRNCPVFQTQRQAGLVKEIYQRADLLSPDNRVLFQWNTEPTFLFVMSDHSYLFSTREDLKIGQIDFSTVVHKTADDCYLPLYESKMFHQFDHRWASITSEGSQVNLSNSELRCPTVVAQPRYWMRSSDAATKLDVLPHKWLIAIRGITNATNERTAIAAIIPKYPVGHSAQVFRFYPSADAACSFLMNINAFAFDFAARTKVGGSNLSSFILRQLPVLPSTTFGELSGWNPAILLAKWIAVRVLELTYTAWDLQPFAQDCGYDGPPFRWDEDRRFLLRCEMDAAYFHLYSIARDDVEYIMETFPIVKRKDEAAHGEYRTKRVILEIYDAMQRAIETDQPYQTLLDPPPADPRVAHPPKGQI